MLLTNSTINGKVIHQPKEPYIRSTDCSLVTNHLCYNVTNLNFVTDFNASHCGLLSGHLEQLSITCTNLKQLNLAYNESCLKTLKLKLKLFVRFETYYATHATLTTIQQLRITDI